MEGIISRRDAIRGIGAAGLVGLAGCSGGDGGDGGEGTPSDSGADGTSTPTADSSGGSSDTISGAWMYLNEVGDLGWSWAHDQGRQATDRKYDWLETDYTEAVAVEDADRVMTRYAKEGYDVIFATGFGAKTFVSVAEQFPDTRIEVCVGMETRENLGRYYGRIYQTRYLAGMAAGMMTETDTLGYVAAYPTAQVLRGVNAHALGAAAVNEDVTMKVRWTNTWYDPPKEKEAANALIDEGVDVMAQHQDSPACVQAANEAGIWATGYDAPMQQFGGENYITSPIWHWEAFHNPTVEAIHDGTWEGDFYWEGLNAGIVDLSEWGPQVPEAVKSEVARTRTAIENGEMNVWEGSKFEGESDEFLYRRMNSYADPVEGTVPQ